MVMLVHGAPARELVDAQAAAIAALLSWAGTAHRTEPDTEPDTGPDLPRDIGSTPAEEDRAA